MFKGEVAILSCGLLIAECFYFKCNGRVNYPNSCYLTCSCRTPNQVRCVCMEMLYVVGGSFLVVLLEDFKALLFFRMQLFTFSPKIIFRLQTKKK